MILILVGGGLAVGGLAVVHGANWVEDSLSWSDLGDGEFGKDRRHLMAQLEEPCQSYGDRGPNMSTGGLTYVQWASILTGGPNME